MCVTFLRSGLLWWLKSSSSLTSISIHMSSKGGRALKNALLWLRCWPCIENVKSKAVFASFGVTLKRFVPRAQRLMAEAFFFKAFFPAEVQRGNNVPEGLLETRSSKTISRLKTSEKLDVIRIFGACMAWTTWSNMESCLRSSDILLGTVSVRQLERLPLALSTSWFLVRLFNKDP